MHQFQQLGQMTGGWVLAILTGSSEVLCELCYKQINPEVRKSYLSDKGVELNSGRYPYLCMQPAHGQQQFCALLDHIVEADKIGHSDQVFFKQGEVLRIQEILNEKEELELACLYNLTGGKFQDIQEALSKGTLFTEKHVDWFATAWETNEHFREVLKHQQKER